MDTSCDNCVYAVFFEDMSVGIWPYVEECSCSFPASKDIFDERGEDEDCSCPFFIKKHEPECEKIRCSACGNPYTILRNYDKQNETMEVLCSDCNAVKTIPMLDLPMC